VRQKRRGQSHVGRWYLPERADRTEDQHRSGYDISITNLTATGAKTAGFIVGLPESPIKSLTLTNVQITAEKGMTISNATVTTQAFEVKAAGGPPFIVLEQAKMQDK
jgi:hypothetical protein